PAPGPGRAAADRFGAKETLAASGNNGRALSTEPFGLARRARPTFPTSREQRRRLLGAGAGAAGAPRDDQVAVSVEDLRDRCRRQCLAVFAELDVHGGGLHSDEGIVASVIPKESEGSRKVSSADVLP